MNASKSLEMLIEDITPLFFEMETMAEHGRFFGISDENPQMDKVNEWARKLRSSCIAYAHYVEDKDLCDVEVLDIHKIGLIKIVRTALDAQECGVLSKSLKEVKDFIEGLIEAGTIQYKTYKEVR